jgi:hypothetical protein
MEYDYNKFEEYLIKLLENRTQVLEPEIGDNISPISEIKVAFDGYGDLETEDANGDYEYIEHGNTNLESYAIYIHKNSPKRGFVFPEHDTYSFTFGNMVQHRPDEEVCLFAWHEFIDNDDTSGWTWHIIPLEDRLSDDNAMTAEQVVEILEILVNRYFAE